jgi:hypothetical protein
MKLIVWIITKVILVWALWNWLMPNIGNLPTISIWQAFGLSLLIGLLFKKVNLDEI